MLECSCQISFSYSFFLYVCVNVCSFASCVNSAFDLLISVAQILVQLSAKLCFYLFYSFSQPASHSFTQSFFHSLIHSITHTAALITHTHTHILLFTDKFEFGWFFNNRRIYFKWIRMAFGCVKNRIWNFIWAPKVIRPNRPMCNHLEPPQHWLCAYAMCMLTNPYAVY